MLPMLLLGSVNAALLSNYFDPLLVLCLHPVLLSEVRFTVRGT